MEIPCSNYKECRARASLGEAAVHRKMSCDWPCLQCWTTRVKPEFELAGGPTLQQSEESVCASCVSVDAPEPYASRQWSRDIVRRMSVPANLRNASSSVAMGASAKPSSGGSMTREKRHYIRTFFHVPDNKLSLKLFGSQRGVREEQERQEQTAFYVIHPCSIFRVYWDVLMLTILSINVTFLPVAIAFFKQNIEPGWVAFNCISDFLFIIDIILHFYTGIITADNTVLLDLKQIRIMYLKKWFAIDLISVFPFDYIVLGITESVQVNDLLRASRALRLLRLIKLLSLLRLLKLIRFLRYLTKWEELIKATRSVLRIFNLILLMLLIAHWDGCVQFLVPYLQEFPEDSWVATNSLQNATIAEQYTWSLFKAISHMLCIGYGQSPPNNMADTWLTIVSMLLGASFYAVFIGHISTLIHAVDSPSRQYNEKLNQVDEYMRYHKLPKEMRQRVHEYYYHRYRGQLFNESAILDELSFPLREEICRANCQELVRSVPFLCNASDSFISTIITKLHCEVYLPGDYIVRHGTVGHHMYFVQDGSVDVLSEDGTTITTLAEGSYFGEICLLLRCRRVASVQAVSVCVVYSLSVDDFHTVLKEFPDVRNLMETVANERLAMIRSVVEENSFGACSGSSDEAVDQARQDVTLAKHLTPISEQGSDYANAEDIV